MDKEIYLEKLRSLYESNNASNKLIDAVTEYASNLLNSDLPVIMNTEHLSCLLGVSLESLMYICLAIEEKYYHLAYIPKKNGGKREILSPAISLKEIHRWINQNILSAIKISPYATGFHKKRSILTNAEMHMGKRCVVNMDMKDFFPSITQEQIFKVFYYYGYTIEVSHVLSRLCTYEGRMPQGAPTSPYLSNIVCLKLDKRLSELAKCYDASYSRYADDITFSSNHDIKAIIPIASLIIEDEGFAINSKKTRIAYDYQRQEVTGLIVNNDAVTVPKGYKKKMLQEIYYCKKYGVENHLEHINCTKAFYRDHMYGKAYFIYMVEKELGRKILSMLDEIDWEM